MIITEIIENSQSTLTEKQRSITDYILNNIDMMTFITLKDLAKNSGCTEVTILKLCKKLGFDTFADMKNAFRAYRIRPDYNTDQDSTSDSDVDIDWPDEASDIGVMLEGLVSYEKKSINSFLDNLDYEKFKLAAEKIIEARIVYILGRGTSLDVADCFRRRLSSLGLNSQLINPEDVSLVQASLNKISSDDAFVFITYPMYYLPMVNIAEFIKRSKAFSAVITDNASAKITNHCDCVIETGNSGRGYYYSFSHAMIATNIITNIIQFLMQQDGRKTGPDDLLEFIGANGYMRG